MARNRMIKPDFWQDEKIGSVSRDARLAFIGLWNFADDGGFCRASPTFIRAQLFPFDDITIKYVSEILLELCEKGLILMTEHNKESFLVIKNFKKHQKIDKPSKNRYIFDDDYKSMELFISSSISGVVDDYSDMNIKEKEKEKEKVVVVKEQPTTKLIYTPHDFESDFNQLKPSSYPIQKLSGSSYRDFIETAGKYPDRETWLKVLNLAFDSYFVDQGKKVKISMIVKEDYFTKIHNGEYNDEKYKPRFAE